MQHIQQNKGRVEDDIDTVIDAINQISDKQYNSMADVEHEIGQVR